MLHSHNAIAGNLHASAQLARLSFRVGGLSSTQFLPISQILRLEKKLWSREYSSATRSTVNTCRPRHGPLGVVSGRSLLSGSREYVGTEDETARSTWNGHGRSTSQHLRSFSHRTSGHRAPLPRGGPARDSGQPARMNSPAFAPQKSRKGPSRASILRGTLASDIVLRGIQSPDAERERQEKEFKEEEIKRKAKEAKEERERQQRLDRQEKEYDAKVTQPLKKWQDQLSRLSSKLPTSLGMHIQDIRVHARREWQQQYVEQCERPIASFGRKLDRIEALLKSFTADAAHTLAQTISKAKAAWPQYRFQLLEKDIGSFSEDLAELKRDLRSQEAQIRAMQKAIRTLMPQLLEDHEELKKSGLHFRSRVLANNYSYAVAEVLRCLNDSSLVLMRQELAKRKKWTISSGGSSMPKYLWLDSRLFRMTRSREMSRESALNSGIDGNLMLGAHQSKTLEAFFGLVNARFSLEHDATTTTQLLHTWRQLDIDLRTLKEVPYLFGHQRAYDRVDLLKHEYMDSLVAAHYEYKVFGTIVSFRNPSAPLRPTSRLSRMAELFTRVSDGRTDIEALFSAIFCEGLSDLLLAPTDALNRSLIATYSPFHTYLSAFQDLQKVVASCHDGHRKLQCSSRQRSVFSTLAVGLQDDVNQTRSILRKAVAWSGASILYYGKVYYPRLKSRSKEALLNHSSITFLMPAACEPLAMSVDSLLASSFYTQRKAVSVIYVHEYKDANSAFQQLTSAKTLAFDAIVMDYTNEFNVRLSRLEFILLASQDTVVICHAGLLNSVGRTLWNLCFILENPGITKVGFNMGFLQRHFSQECNWDLQGCVNLAGDADPIVTLDNPSDPTQELQAQLAWQYLKLKIPATTDARALLSDGLQDPLRHFRILASRAYLPLLLYRRTHAGGEGNDIHLELSSDHGVPPTIERIASSQPPAERVEFGSIFIGPGTAVRSVVTPKSRISCARNSRAEYLDALTKRIAKAVLQNAEGKSTDTFKYLQAYYLLTSFQQSLRFVMHLLRSKNIDDLCDGVSRVAIEFKVPLHDGHWDSLETEAVSLGARKTAAKRKARGMIRRTVSSERSVAPMLAPSGPPSLPEIRPVLSESVKIQEDVSSSTRVAISLLPDEERRIKRNRQNQERKNRKKQSNPDYRSFMNRKRSERYRRARERTRSITDYDATPSEIARSAADDASIGHPENAVIPWASFGMRNAEQKADTTTISVTPAKPQRTDAIRGVPKGARKGRSQPLKQAGGRKTRSQDPGGLKVVKMSTVPPITTSLKQAAVYLKRAAFIRSKGKHSSIGQRANVTQEIPKGKADARKQET